MNSPRFPLVPFVTLTFVPFRGQRPPGRDNHSPAQALPATNRYGFLVRRLERKRTCSTLRHHGSTERTFALERRFPTNDQLPNQTSIEFPATSTQKDRPRDLTLARQTSVRSQPRSARSARQLRHQQRVDRVDPDRQFG